jgi:DNA-binding GntR family transcriptional regulator
MSARQTGIRSRRASTARATPAQNSGSSKAQPVEKDLSSPDQIVRAILSGLYEGHYVQGQRLVEADLAQEYNVGRGSIRQAFTRLAADGIISLSRHRGAQVRWMTRLEVKEVLMVMEVLSGLAARLAAEMIDFEDHRTIFRASFDKLMEFEDKQAFAEFVRARNAFYRTMLQIGGNAELIRTFPSLHVHLVRVQFRTYPTPTEQVRFKDYQQIYDAIMLGDEAAAERVTRQHIKRTAVAINQLPEDAFAPTNFLR